MSIKEMFRPAIDGFYSSLTRISPLLNTQVRYFRLNRRFANLEAPQTFSEKITWLKLYRYNQDPLVKQCADKLLVREYAKKNGLGFLLNELYAVFESPEELYTYQLPDQFVLKWNFGCGYNYICTDKTNIDLKEVISKLNKWRNKKYWLLYSEFQYKIEKKYLLCERFLDTPGNADLLDYKVYCFNGEPKAILVISRKNENEKKAVFMDPHWQMLGGVRNKKDTYKSTLAPEKPASLDTMIETARILSRPFPFVRVDFYDWKNRAILGEMTFTPAAGILPAETEINGISMGTLLNL